MAVILKNLIKRSMLTIPTFLYVADICRIAKRSGLDDGKDFISTNSNVPPQKSNTQNCKNDVHFQYAVFAFIE